MYCSGCCIWVTTWPRDLLQRRGRVYSNLVETWDTLGGVEELTWLHGLFQANVLSLMLAMAG